MELGAHLLAIDVYASTTRALARGLVYEPKISTNNIFDLESV